MVCTEIEKQLLVTWQFEIDIARGFLIEIFIWQFIPMYNTRQVWLMMCNIDGYLTTDIPPLHIMSNTWVRYISTL